MSAQWDRIDVDVLVVGGGGAAIRAAIAAHEEGARVAVVSKGTVSRSGATPMACPSYQAAVAHEDPRDSKEIAFRDTVEEGRRLGDENLIWALTEEASERARDMERYGLRYEMNGEHWFQVQHPGHSYARNLVIRGCGYAMMRALKKESLRREIPLFEDVMVLDLLTEGRRVTGAVALNLRQGGFMVFPAKAVVLATGGYTQLWEFNDTSADLTGEGVAAAYRAGADLVDMEMMLYYPSCLTWPPEIRGTLVQHEGLINPKYIGAALVNKDGEYVIDPGLPPVRDELMKIMMEQILAGKGSPTGGLYIDFSRSPRSREEIFALLKRLDSLPYQNLTALEIDITKQPIEVAPGVHFALGGVRINERAETSLEGLYAAGEVSGNVHGANRTSGNALAETQVFGRRAGMQAAAHAARHALPEPNPAAVAACVARAVALLDRGGGSGGGGGGGEHRPCALKRRLQRIVQKAVGYRRSEETMRRGLEELDLFRRRDLPRLTVERRAKRFNYEWQEAIEVEGMAEVAEIVIRCALLREESRGHHWRTDFPEQRDGEWLKHTIARCGGDGQVELSTAPVVRLAERVPVS